MTVMRTTFEARRWVYSVVTSKKPHFSFRKCSENRPGLHHNTSDSNRAVPLHSRNSRSTKNDKYARRNKIRCTLCSLDEDNGDVYWRTWFYRFIWKKFLLLFFYWLISIFILLFSESFNDEAFGVVTQLIDDVFSICPNSPAIHLGGKKN